MNTKMEASWIDNFFVYNPNISVVGSDNAEEISQILVPIVQLF